MVRIESNANFLSCFLPNVQFPLQTRHALLSSSPIPNILNKSSSSAFRPALSNLWLLLVVKYLSCYCWFSHDVTKFQTSELLILLRFHFHDVLEQLKTNIQTNFHSEWVLGLVIDYA